ncbi:potassium channel subfamily K member 18-like [Adelges cooleyi]|uniref:potassium channel subfamily K member 18-like n=1 Tax=Adelges cooleyi TaxID=133065 RepID=UPI00217F2D19|nr:potassium channel subfamily K member 18-like [Adelges cooleyi]
MPVRAAPSSLVPPLPPTHQSVAAEPRLSRCVRRFFAHLFSNLGLFGLVAGYVIVGAFVFRFLEAGNERQQRDRIGRLKNDCLGELWNITVRMHVLHELNWTKLVYEPLQKFETQIISTKNIQGYDSKNTEQWSLTGALLYSVTVITTIGYGNLAPKTPEGKIVTMVYALFGVPLMLLCISNLGSLLAGTFQFAYSHACCFTKRKSDRKNKSMKKSKTVVREEVIPHAVNSLNGHHRNGQQTSRTRKQIGCKPVYRLTTEAKHVLCECAEYQLANSPTHDHVAAHILRQLGDRPDLSTVPEDEYLYDDDNEDCYQCQLHDGSHNGTPSRVPLIRGSRQKEMAQRPLEMTVVVPAKKKPKRSGNAPPGVPVALVLLVLVGYICVGAAVFAAWEGWTFIDGAYFCFVTLSTIGFGDLVPGKSFQGTDTQNGQLQLVACCGYLLFGLVLIAMSFSLVQEEVVSKCRHVARYVGLLKQPRPATQPAPYAL